MATLLDGSDSGSDAEFKINNDYADNYNKWRGKEELQKLKDRYGDNENDESSSSAESEEEDLSQIIDKDFLKTLGCLKSNDPRIYNQKEVFFSQLEPPCSTSSKTQKKEKAMYIRDYKRKVLLEKNGVLSDEDEEEGSLKRPSSPTYHQEQEQLKKSFKAVLEESESDEDDSLLKKRNRSSKEQTQEEETYLRWLKGEVPETQDVNELSKLKEYWSNPKLESGEAFLRDYILNKRFLETELDQTGHPTYDEVVEDLSEDEEELEKQETFEHKFNFRFEEPDPEFLKRYPRTMDNTLRRKDDRRKKKREEVKARKVEEKEKRREELNRLKALKRVEIMERLESLKEITGTQEGAFNELDLEKDFDPDEHDRKMQAIFNEDYYAEGDGEIQKPEFPPDEELDGENWDNWTGNDHEGGHEFNMDAEYDESQEGSKVSFQDEMLDASRSKRKRRRRSRFAQSLAQKKPVFDPEQKSFEEYLDEYYKLDYEDIIGDQPVRFPYRTVVPNDFGLTTEEILLAKDKELNRWCSLKKTCQYRTEEEEKYDLQAFQKKAQNEVLKHKVLTSIFQSEEQEETKGEKQVTSGKRKRKSKNKGKAEAETEVNDDRLRAFGINPKKHKNKIKYGKKT